MKIDPYKHKERYYRWKENTKKGISGISKINSDLLLKYIEDMEHGINISNINVKGSRSYPRLNTLREKLLFLFKKLNKYYNVIDITKISEEQVYRFFAEMRNGTITRKDGKEYKSVADFAKIFKAFWHWYQKVNSKKDIEIPDITLDLDTSRDKPKWVYLTEEQVRKLCDNAKYEYRVLMMFLLDTGIRSPGELINVKVSDIFNNYKELNIRDEISKTFGRRIKLMLCSDLIKNYIETNNLQPDDYIFPINPKNANKYFKRLALNILGDKLSLAGQKYSELTLYDFRHISCCYWLPRYKSESALKFRFGWKKSEKIHYYSEMLGMRDTISEEDLLVDVTKTEIEQRLTISENKKEVLQERIDALENQMKKILGLVKQGCLVVSGN